ncbi:MAG: MATE family efflux transporter [Lachnospiraceae bacterium]
MQQEQQRSRMTEAPIGKLIMSLSVPTIISMLVTSVYNMADTFFVSKLGTSASGAVGIVFSLMAMIQAVGFTFGMGSGSWISRLLGANDEKKTIEVGASAFYTTIVLGILLTVFGEWKIDGLMRLLGASETILPYARDYARYILMAAPVMGSSFVLNNIIRSEGRAKFAMIGITAGGVLNIILDPLFIFVFDLGIAGAAIATAISQLVSFCILLACFLSGKTITKLGIHRVSGRPVTYLQIIKNGLPSFCRQGLASAASVQLNVQAAVYGDAAVAGMAIVGKIFMIIFSVMIGFGQGFQPVIGYNYGAKESARVKESIRFTLKTATIGMSLAAVIVYLLAPWLLQMFVSDDPAVREIGTAALRAQAFSMPLLPIGVVSNMTFQSIGKSWKATVMSAMRQGIFFIPLIYLLPQMMGLTGVEITQAASDILTAFACAPFLFRFYRSSTDKN